MTSDDSSTQPVPPTNSAASGTHRRPVAVWFVFIALATLVAVPVLAVAGPTWLAWWRYAPEEGDILFQSLPRQEIVNAIEGATGSPWSHCGVVCRRDGRWVVCEAIGDVRETPLDQFHRRGRDGRFAAYRLRQEDRRHAGALVEKARAYLGRPYDVRYRMDDESIYCSELVWKAYRDATGEPLGALVKLGDLKWRPYRQVIERLEGGPVPVDREMITPRDLARAKQLELVAGAGFEAEGRVER